jgi:hypothetical protein
VYYGLSAQGVVPLFVGIHREYVTLKFEVIMAAVVEIMVLSNVTP